MELGEAYGFLRQIWLDAAPVAETTISASSGDGGTMMLRRIQPKLTLALFAAGMISLSTASAWAFTRENVLPDGGNYSFDDPDKRPTNSDNHNTTQGSQPFGSNGPTVQFGVRQGPVSTFGQGNRYTTPDPYFRPLNGN